MTKLIASCSFDYNEESKEIIIDEINFSGNELKELIKFGKEEDWNDDLVYESIDHPSIIGFMVSKEFGNKAVVIGYETMVGSDSFDEDDE